MRNYDREPSLVARILAAIEAGIETFETCVRTLAKVAMYVLLIYIVVRGFLELAY